jgi:hypothetical protein
VGKNQSGRRKNLIELGTRSLLIEDGKKLILVDCGLGNKQDDKFFGHYSLWGDDNLDKNLKKYGFVKEDITMYSLLTFTLTTVVVLLNGMMTEQDTDLL